MLNWVDDFLNKITMYRLVLYYLIVLIIAGIVLSLFGILHYKPLDLIFSTLILLVVSWAANKILARLFRIPANVESVYITALILALIVSPPEVRSPIYFAGLAFLFWAAVLSMASKYLIAWHGKHIFNPAAFAVVLIALTINQSASWWVGTMWMLPFVFIGGLLVVRKIQRFDLVLTFFVIAIVVIVLTSPSRSEPLVLIQKILVDSPIVFFAFIMLTEPLTAPPAKLRRMIYAGLVGLLFAPSIHIGSFYSTPELALLVGNIFGFFVSPKGKYLLTLKSKDEIGLNTHEFVFQSDQRVIFKPGQYMEWTLDHNKPDNRGNRRYFTLASSPTERMVHLGIKFYEHASTFKEKMFSLNPGSQVLAGQLSGDFILPRNKNQKLVFIAGGIGITPFRSMLKFLIDNNEKRDIVVFYSNNRFEEIAYEDVLEQVRRQFGIKTVYVLTDKVGRLNAEMIAEQVLDYRDRTYYISGPHSMVSAFEETLKNMEIPSRQIKIDFFPGFA